jgi:hypothetical protein
MPTYTFKNNVTGEITDVLMSWKDREQYIRDNPHMEPVIQAPALGDSVRLGVRSVDDGFREVLSKISSANYKSNLKDKLSR